MSNHRVYYALQQVGFALDGTNTYTAAHGVQSVGITTTFNLENVFELGQLETYQIVEQVPDVEVTLEKVLDGYPLLYHLATNGAANGNLTARAVVKTTLGLSVFPEVDQSASGTPLAEVSMSGLVVSSVGYAFTVDGNATESLGLVGNTKVWRNIADNSDTSYFGGAFAANNDAPANLLQSGIGGVQKRDNVMFVPHSSSPGTPGVDANGMTNAYVTVLPREIYGVSSSGTNPLDTANPGSYKVPVQSINVSADLNRDNIFELGRLFPYHKYVNYPIQVRTDIEVVMTQMDNVSAKEGGGVNGAPSGFQTNYQTLRVQLQDGTRVDMGTRNKLTSVSQSGGDARQGGGNATNRYSYTNNNSLHVYSPADPAALA